MAEKIARRPPASGSCAPPRQAGVDVAGIGGLRQRAHPGGKSPRRSPSPDARTQDSRRVRRCIACSRAGCSARCKAAATSRCMVVNSNESVGEGRVSPVSASASEPSTSSLMNAAGPCRETELIEGRHRHHRCASSISVLPSPARQRRPCGMPPRRLTTVGLSGLRLNARVPASRPTATGSIATARSRP